MKLFQKPFVLLALSSLLCLGACNEYRSFQSASKVSQLSGNPFMYRLSKSILGSLKDVAVKSGRKSDAKGLNLLSPLDKVLGSPEQTAMLKSMLAADFKVPEKKMDMGWGKLGTVKDLVTFVAKNGKDFRMLTY